MEYPTPSVGRQVWYFPIGQSIGEDGPQPWAATVVKVHGVYWQHSPFSPVNLLAIDPDNGEQHFVENVRHCPDDVGVERFAWMPHQLHQHNKAIAREVEEKARIEQVNAPKCLDANSCKIQVNPNCAPRY